MVKVKNLSTVTMFVGLPGSGKTTYAASIVKYCNKKNIKVFSNVPIKGAYSYDWFEDFGEYDQSHSVIIMDEAGITVDNRSWEKNFTKNKVEALKILRHRHSKLVVFSQTWNDCDVKIRSMTGLLYIVRRSLLLGFTAAIPVFRKIDVDEETHEFKEIYYKDFPLLRFFSTKRIFRPLYYNLFDSWEAPELPIKEFDIFE